MEYEFQNVPTEKKECSLLLFKSVLNVAYSFLIEKDRKNLLNLSNIQFWFKIKKKILSWIKERHEVKHPVKHMLNHVMPLTRACDSLGKETFEYLIIWKFVFGDDTEKVGHLKRGHGRFPGGPVDMNWAAMGSIPALGRYRMLWGS